MSPEANGLAILAVPTSLAIPTQLPSSSERICEMAAKRLQLQEKLGKDIADIISEAAPKKIVMIQTLSNQK